MRRAISFDVREVTLMTRKQNTLNKYTHMSNTGPRFFMTIYVYFLFLK